MKIILFTLFFLLVLPTEVYAHSGRTDSSGGHNCNVGACAGTYHYHNGGSSYTPPTYTYTQPTSTPKPIVTKRPLPTSTPLPLREITTTPTPVISANVQGTSTSDKDGWDDGGLLVVGGIISYFVYKLFHPPSKTVK